MASTTPSPTVDATIHQSTSTLKHISDALFGSHSFAILILSLLIGFTLGKIAATILRRLSRAAGRGADASTNLETVNRLRRVETWLILSVAVARVLFLVLALYFWWTFTHVQQQSTALVGVSAVLVVIIGGVFGPLLRDFAFGSGMMAEHWFGVGDLVTIEPNTIQGVVERITLRSTRIRGLNGDVIWVSNQNISSVSIAQKGVITLAVEMFVSSRSGAERLIEQVNAMLPNGPSLVVRPLAIMTKDERTQGLWHITAIAETAPGRNWLIERTAIELLQKLDEKSKNPVLMTDPVARYADNDTEREFARAITNAKKTRRAPRRPLAKAARANKQNKSA